MSYKGCGPLGQNNNIMIKEEIEALKNKLPCTSFKGSILILVCKKCEVTNALKESQSKQFHSLQKFIFNSLLTE